MTAKRHPVIVVEDDPFTRIVGAVLDPATTDERTAAFVEFFAHDEPNFIGWRDGVRTSVKGLFPAEVRLVSSEEEMRAALPDASILLVESFDVTAEDVAAAPGLVAVQKYGTITDHIDTVACAERGVQVLTLRRRANIACAELTFALMLTLAKKLHKITGLISVDQLKAAGYEPTTFDRRHTANSGWARISGLGMLHESTLGIIGLGEIGREVALRAAAFGMHTLYYQRHRLDESDEQRFHATYAPLEALLGGSDYVSIQLPITPSTRDFFNRERFAQMKRGAVLVNTARAEIIERAALIEALKSGRLGGFALDPLYEEPGRDDDELLGFENVILTPHTAAQPRFNALRDMAQMIAGMAAAHGR